MNKSASVMLGPQRPLFSTYSKASRLLPPAHGFINTSQVPSRRGLLGRTAAATSTPPATATAKDQPSNKEESRKYRRNVFTPADWVQHRSTDRYQRHIKTMFTSGNVASLLGPTLAVTGVLSQCLRSHFPLLMTLSIWLML